MLIIAGMFQTSNPLVNTTNYVFSSARNIPFDTDKDNTKNEYKDRYLLFGIGIIICIFLLVITIQLCRKSKSAKRKILVRQANNQNMIQNEFQSQTRQENQEDDGSHSEQNEEFHFYRTLKDNSDDKEDNLEIYTPSLSSTSSNYEKPISLSLSLSHERECNAIYSFRKSVSTKQVRDKSRLSAESSDSYLNPVFDTKVQE